MKRILLIGSLLLAAAIGASAQSLIGTWTTRFSETEQQDGAVTTMEGTDLLVLTESTFTRTASFTVTISSGTDPVNIKITANGTVPGTWTRKGDQLTLTPDKKAKPQIDVTTENAPEFISTIFSEQLRKEVKSALKESETGTIVSLTDKELSIRDDEGEILVYTRK